MSCLPFWTSFTVSYCETLFPRIGNLDMVHSYLVDMLLFCQREKEANTGESLDSAALSVDRFRHRAVPD